MKSSKEDICTLILQQAPCYVHHADVGEDADKRSYLVLFEKIDSVGYDTTISVEQGFGELASAPKAVNCKTPYTNV